MKGLTEFIYEKLDPQILKKISAQRLNSKKLELLAVKKGLGSIDMDELAAIVDTVYGALVNYKTSDDMKAALDDGKIEGWSKIHDPIIKANSNKSVNVDMIIDVIAKIAGGMKLDAAITDTAKKL